MPAEPLCRPPILLALPGADILVIGEDGSMVRTPYAQTENVVVTRRFLEGPQGMLRILLGNE